MAHTTELVPAGTSLTAVGEGSNVTVDGSLVININGTDYTLRGTVGSELIVKFENEFPNGANIGTITNIVGSVASALGVPGLENNVDTAITAVKSVPLLGEVARVLTDSPVQITYLEINTATKTYGFGFAVDFRDQNIKVNGIQLNAFGLKVTYVKTD